RDATCFERPQIGDRACERERKLLCLGAARIVDHASVRDREWSTKTCLYELLHKLREVRCELVPWPDRRASRCNMTERIEAAAHLDPLGRDAAALDQRGEVLCRLARLSGDVEVSDNAGVEINPIENALQRFNGAVEPVAVRVEGA